MLERQVNERELVERADALRECLVRWADAADAARQISDETVKALSEAGLFDIISIRDASGRGHALLTHARCAAMLAEGCGSTGWVMALHGVHAEVLRAMPASVREQMAETASDHLTTAVFAPEGRLVPTGNGYLLSGRWGFGSGCTHARYALLAATVETEAETEGRDAEARLAWVPMESIRIKDTWHTMALRGTGSHDLIARDVVVPAERTLSLEAAFEGRPEFAPDDERLPLMPLLTLVAASPALGMARGFVRAFAARARSKRALSGELQVERPVLLNRLAESQLEVEAAERLLFESLARLVSPEETGRRSQRDERVRYCTEGAFVMTLCKRAVDRLMESAGASAHFETSALRRAHADLDMLRGHAVFDLDRLGVAFGRSLAGADPGDPLI